MRTALALLLLALATPAVAHEDGGGAAQSWPAAVPIAVTAALILAAWIGRRARLRPGEALAILAGLAMLALALIGPLPALEHRSLAAHMLAHELLIVGAAPLLAHARAWHVTMPALPFAMRRGGAALLRAARRCLSTMVHPVAATLISGAILWLWHVPGLFLAALENPLLHALQHLSFFASALLFWAAMQAPAHRRREGAAVLYLFGTALHTGALGALITFSPRTWYALEGSPPFGLSPIEDQQLAGLIMWIPGGLVYAAGALLLLGRMLARPAAPMRPHESGA